MKVVDKNINEVTKTIDKCKAEITRLRVAVTTAKRNAKKSVEKITTMEQDVLDMENKLRQMKDERLEIEKDAAKLLTCVEEITEQLGDGEQAYADIKKEVAQLTKEENKLKSDKVDVDEKVKSCTNTVNEYKGAIHQLEVKIAKLKLHDIPNETIEPLKKFTPEEIAERRVETVENEMQAAENHLKAAKPNLNAIQEYRERQNIYVERSKELEAISLKRCEMRKLYDNLRTQRKEEFLRGYNIIKLKLKEMYQMITLGGDADFELYLPCIITNRPPLYVMDEIDAALDFKNVSIVGHYIKERTKNAQSNMFELCDNLIGIYKTYNCTKTITIDPRVYDKKDQVVPTPDTNNDGVNNEEENVNGNRNSGSDPAVSNEKENDDNNRDTDRNNRLEPNSESSAATMSTDEDGAPPESTSDLTETSNINSEEILSGDSQNQSDQIIDASFQREEMEVDS
ncbi:hypothetical protein NQ318_012136 [Aromia moschata]|uniref:Uncharacterized protein n=1 Tax=Aromia moschata TaxID=1265417 RepID=A0AAV8YZD0_9CUCU|nr:hypothetical protein NQ318_012136 [Aromia moschata]